MILQLLTHSAFVYSVCCSDTSFFMVRFISIFNLQCLYSLGLLFVSVFSEILLVSMTMTAFVSLAMPCVNMQDKCVHEDAGKSCYLSDLW